jgi:hypothetical protein
VASYENKYSVNRQKSFNIVELKTLRMGEMMLLYKSLFSVYSSWGRGGEREEGRGKRGGGRGEGVGIELMVLRRQEKKAYRNRECLRWSISYRWTPTYS